MADMNESIEQQTTDSDIIFTAISTGGFEDFKQAQQAVVVMYVTDMSFSRSGISHALKRLEEHYSTMDDDPFTEEEQRFNDALDGIGEEYDKLIAEKHEEQRKETIWDNVFMFTILGIVVVWAVYEIWSVL